MLSEKSVRTSSTTCEAEGFLEDVLARTEKAILDLQPDMTDLGIISPGESRRHKDQV